MIYESIYQQLKFAYCSNKNMIFEIFFSFLNMHFWFQSGSAWIIYTFGSHLIGTYSGSGMKFSRIRL